MPYTSPLSRQPTTLREVMLSLERHVEAQLGWNTDIFWHVLEDEMPRIYPSIPEQGYYCTLSYGGSEYDEGEFEGGILAERATVTFTLYTRNLRDQRNRDNAALLPSGTGLYDAPERLVEELTFADLLDSDGKPFLRDLLTPLGRTPVVGTAWEGDHGGPYEVLFCRVVFRAHFVRLIAAEG